MVKAQLEKTLLGAICSHIRLVLRPTGAFVDVALDLKLLESLQLEVSAFTVQKEIVAQRKLKLSFDQVRWAAPPACVLALWRGGRVLSKPEALIMGSGRQ